MNRLFQEHLGTSVSALKMEVRLLKSLALLKNPTNKVIDVAGPADLTTWGCSANVLKGVLALAPTNGGSGNWPGKQVQI